MPPAGVAVPTATTPTGQAIAVWVPTEQASQMPVATAASPTGDAAAAVTAQIAQRYPTAAAGQFELAQGKGGSAKGRGRGHGRGDGHGRKLGHYKEHGNHGHHGKGKGVGKGASAGKGSALSLPIGLPTQAEGPAKAQGVGFGKGSIVPTTGVDGVGQGFAGVGQLTGPAKGVGQSFELPGKGVGQSYELPGKGVGQSPEQGQGSGAVSGLLDKIKGFLSRINFGKVALFAGLGAAATMVIPPLAPLGAIGGALAGAALSLLL